MVDEPLSASFALFLDLFWTFSGLVFRLTLVQSNGYCPVAQDLDVNFAIGNVRHRAGEPQRAGEIDRQDLWGGR